MKHLLAALIFFTRLPLWRIVEVPTVYFKRVVDYWSVVGWLTGGVMAAVLWLAAQVLPMSAAVILALLSRLLITGALHEDGLADFCDGFGGGTTRERIMEIMKDSHIGTYGVLGLILYYALVFALLSSLTAAQACAVVFTGDIWSKFCASHIINFLPYARREQEAKAKVIYDKLSPAVLIITFITSALPVAALMPGMTRAAALAPVVTIALLITLMHKRLQGYTGDCCGASFLLCELSYYLIATLIINLNI
jgi:adenosylcobinamide-GDP ribazoletransferase